MLATGCHAACRWHDPIPMPHQVLLPFVNGRPGVSLPHQPHLNQSPVSPEFAHRFALCFESSRTIAAIRCAFQQGSKVPSMLPFPACLPACLPPSLPLSLPPSLRICSSGMEVDLGLRIIRLRTPIVPSYIPMFLAPNDVVRHFFCAGSRLRVARHSHTPMILPPIFFSPFNACYRLPRCLPLA